MKPGNDPLGRSLTPLVLTLATIAIWGAIILCRDGRTWGLAVWAWLPPAVALPVLGLAALISVALNFSLVPRLTGLPQGTDPITDRAHLWLIPLAVALLVPVFWFASARTHFLGDGYTVISLLASDQPLIKLRQVGEALAHIWVKNLSGIEGEAGARFSFRFLSVFSGAAFVGAVSWFSIRLFARTVQRVLFAAGVITGGHALLFFGYAENYSLFVAAVGIYTLVGLRVASDRISRWWLVPPLALALFFHIMGTALIPSAAYLLLAKSPLGRRMRNWPPRRWLIAAVLSAGAALAAIAWASESSIFFRYSLLPLFGGQFNIGYTMFSPAHLVDFINLLFLLLPGLGLFVLVLIEAISHRRPLTRPALFLLVLTLSSLGTAFIFDPKLGMPRDWDLFSFAGIPLTVSFYFLALNPHHYLRSGLRTALLGILLAIVALSGRVATQLHDSYALPQMRHYMALDPARMAPAFHILRDYYRSKGNYEAADSVEANWRQKHPEDVLVARSEQLMETGRYDEALALARRAISINPAHWSAYSNVGAGFLHTQRWDSAFYYLRLADGINPNNAKVVHNLAYCYAWQRDFEKAERLWQKAFRLDTTQTATLLQLGRLYEMTNRPDKSIATLEHMARQPDPLPDGLAMLAALYARTNRYPEAGEMLRRAVRTGLDTTEANRILATHPRLKSFLLNTE